MLQERREKLHRAIRFGSWQESVEALRGSECPRRLATAKNQQGRCALHVAVLTQNENIVEHIAKKYPATLRVGDNVILFFQYFVNIHRMLYRKTCVLKLSERHAHSSN